MRGTQRTPGMRRIRGMRRASGTGVVQRAPEAQQPRRARRASTARWRRAAPAAAVALGVVATAGACSGGSDPDSGPSQSATGSPSQPDSPAEQGPKQVRRANEAMISTSFTSTGSSTAFEDSEQQTWWDPEQGLRMTVRLKSGEEGEIRCEDGTTYTSATLLAASLEQRGAQVDVPEELSDVFVVVQTSGQKCDAYFKVPASAVHAPRQDTEIDGRATQAFTADNGQTADVYLIAVDKGRLLRMESRRDGRTSTTRYSGYGKEYEIDMPPAEQTMEMSEFRERVS